MPQTDRYEVGRLHLFWDVVQHALAARTPELLREALAGFEEHLHEIEIDAVKEFEKLRELGSYWTGFGEKLHTAGDMVALFFKDRAVLEHFPPIVLDVPHTPVEWMDLRSIQSGPPDATPSPAVPGATISWQGDSCPNHKYENGTLAVFLLDSEDRPWFLSANHAISRNGNCQENEVTIAGCGIVSRHTEPVRIQDRPVLNETDAAVARWDADTPPSAQMESLPPLTDSLVSPNEALVGHEAMRMGMPRDRARGKIAYIGQRVKIDLTAYIPYHALFRNQILIEDIPVADHPNFSRPGDSGSLVCAVGEESTRPIGLLIANSTPRDGEAKAIYSAVSPIGTVLSELFHATGRRFRIMTSPQS